MKKKYTFGLIFVGLLILTVALIGTGYGIWKTKKNNVVKIATNVDCFKIYYSSSQDLTFKNVTPILETAGKKTSPYTITVTNTCENEKELELRLNILNDSTIKSDSLSIIATGDIKIDSTYYTDLKTTKSTDKEVSQSKLIGKINIAPNETKRTNVKIWFNELKNPIINREDYMKTRFEIIDSKDAILPTIKENILDLNKSTDKVPVYNEPSTTPELLKVDNSYYFRGNVTNNYLVFANKLWRIVAINPDNSIKIILNNTLDNTKYSERANAPDYTGIKYIHDDNAVDNTINSYLLNWYQNNLSSYDQYIENYNFCNDSSKKNENGQTIFGALDRLDDHKNPITTCPTTPNDFGGEYTQKIGMITADELAFSGSVFNVENTNSYLNNGTDFFTMSPTSFMYGYQSYVMYLTSSGAMDEILTTKEIGVRPVINLKESLTSEGDGTISNPYVVITNN